MAIEFTSNLEDGILYITSRGVDESFEDVRNYATSLILTAQGTNCRKLLIDERNLEYRLNIMDTYKFAEYAVDNIPQITKVAIVPDPECIDDAQFYENVVSTRGLRLRIFRDLESAKKWVK
ncbi:MAG: hypothetical protein ACLFQM_05250 [Fidelibacterota bacterium]